METRADMTHYYIHIKQDSVSIGSFNSRNYMSPPFRTYKQGNFNEKEIAGFLIGEDDQTILFYVHCWLGNIGFYNEGVLKKLDLLDGIDKTISIVWESTGPRYLRNWEQARLQGQRIAGLFEYLLRFSTNSKNILLCHSMGHAVFLGLNEGLKVSRNYFNLIVFAGADLPSDIFDKDLHYLSAAADSIVVYTHQRDYILKVSSRLHKQKRLGLVQSGELQNFAEAQNIMIVDVTQWPGNRAISPSNHIYFKEHDGVRADLINRIKNSTN